MLRVMMARRILTMLVTAAALGVMSCSDDATRPRFDPAAAVEGDGSAEELRDRWAQWRTLGPRSYAYELHRACFCGDDYVTPAWVEVRDGHVVSARAVVRVRPGFLPGRPLPLELFEPIDSLFADAIRFSQAGERVLVRYDPALGYPAWLTLGTPENDAGIVFVVPRVVPR